MAFKNFEGSEFLGTHNLSLNTFIGMNPVKIDKICGFSKIILLNTEGTSELGPIFDENGIDKDMLDVFGTNVIVGLDTEDDGKVLALNMETTIDEPTEADDEFFKILVQRNAPQDWFQTMMGNIAQQRAECQDYEFKGHEKFNINMTCADVFALCQRLGITTVKAVTAEPDHHDDADVTDCLSEAIEYYVWRDEDFDEQKYMASGAIANQVEYRCETEDDGNGFTKWGLAITYDAETSYIIAITIQNGEEEDAAPATSDMMGKLFGK